MRRSITSTSKVKKPHANITVENLEEDSEEEKVSTNLLGGFFEKKLYVPMST